MAHRTPLGSPVLRILTFVLILGCVLLSSPAQLWAKGCAESVPGGVQPPPQSLWGELQPEYSGGRPLIDATGWTGSQLPNSNFQVSTSVDIENGWLFHSFYGGFSIWDARANPALPTRVSLVGGFERNFPSWPLLTEFTQIVFYIDVPDGNDNLAAVAAITPVGLTIWDTTNKSAPKALYQDTSKLSYQVYAARIGSRDYAFLADFQSDTGLHVYDMTTAKSFNSCIENRSSGEINCPGVYLGRIGNQEPTKYVHGLAVGNRHFVVKTGGSGTGAGVKIYDVTNPQQPQLVVQDFVGFSQFGDSHGVALWTNNGQHYLATRQSKGSQDVGKIFNVTSCLTTGCGGLQSLETWRSQEPLKPYPESTYWLSAVFSRSGNTPFIFFGNHDTCRQGEANFQTEYLLDVSNPANPRDISPQTRITPSLPDPGGRQVDYWSWYYSDTTRGWSHFGPRVAKFNGQYLYRAAATVFDVHKWVGSAGPPTASFGWLPDPFYAGDPVTFTSTSTGGPTTFTWTFPDGSPSTGANPAMQTTTFATPGVKAVKLVVSNSFGQDEEIKNVTVLDPAPAVGGITVSPASPLACQPVTLTATGLGGRPPVSVDWTVTQGQVQFGSGSGNPSFIWQTAGSQTTPNVPPGTYTANVTVSKAGFPSASTSVPVTLGTLDPLPTGSFTPTNDPFSAGRVQFHVNASGATKWTWDFGDGTVETYTDPLTGPNPEHTYRAVNTYAVKVSVSNCLSAQVVTSSPLSVEITQVAPLAVTSFMAQCQIFCDFAPGQAITFNSQQATGDPTQYEYDWNGNGFTGGDDQISATEVTSHTYSAQGTYLPQMRVRRGTEVTAPFPHGQLINIRPSGGGGGGGGGNNPTVTVSGPGSGQVNTAYGFTAAAANCTPGTWNWTAGSGATITNNGTAAVSITWSSAGSKTVVATATGCTSGSKTITIANPGTGTGGLTADFSWLPALPSVGQTVTFNAGASTGSPTVYFWEFPGGASESSSNPTVTRSFATAGPQSVKLTIYKDCVAGSSHTMTSAKWADRLTA